MAKELQITKKDISDIIKTALKEQDKRIDKKFAEQDKRFTGQDKRFAEQDKRFVGQDKRFAEQDKRFLEIIREMKSDKEDMKRWLSVAMEQQDHNFKLALELALGSAEERLKDVFKNDFNSIGEQLDDKVSHEECHKNMVKLQFNKV